MDQRRSQGGRHGRHREDRRDHSREDRRGHSREDRHGQRREDRHGHSQEDRHGHRAEGRRGHGGEGRHGQRREDSHGWRREDRHGHSGENRYGQRREDRRGHSRENREHEQEHWEGHPHSGQDDYYNSGYEGAQEDYPPQDQRGYRDSRYGEQEAYPPMDQRGHHDSRHQPEQEDYPPMDQRGHHDSRHQPDQGNYPPMDQRGHHDSRRQPEQEDYPFMDQRGHHDSRHQPEQEDYPPMDQHGHHESRHQPEQEDYPPMDQHGHNESRHQPEQEDYPPMDQHGHHESRHQPEQEDYPPTDQHGHHESTYQQEQDEYPHQDQNGHVDLKYQGYYPPMDQGRFSSPGHRQQKKQDEYISPEEKEKHPILRRRIISDGHRVLNPMGMRLRRCLPKFDFDAFTKQLGEDELKTFLPHQHSQAGSVYQGEGEEETKERRQFAKEIVGMMEDGETGKGTAGKKVSSFDKKWKYAKTQMWEALQWLVVWRGSFKGIEAQHGSSTTSYFSVLRWLMFLNLFVAVTMVATIVLPQVYFHPDTFTEYRKPLNLANGKPTRQSNEYGVSYNSSEAVDGIKGNESCSRAMASEGTGSTWWQVNLTAVYEIRKVVITTLYGERSDYTVNVINAMSGNSTCRQTERQKNSNSTVEVTCPPGVHGTIVRISETSNETLWLCEVEVYGPPTGGFVKNATYCSDIYKRKMGTLTEEEGISDKVIAVIQGTGWVERTVLFTGHYFNKTFEFKDFTQRSYNMPLAFLFTTITYFFITLVLMILYTGDGVKQSLLSSDEDTHLVFNKVFSGWDYSLMQVEAAELKMKDLVKDFKIYVDQIMEKEKRKAVHTKLKYAARAFVNLLVLVTWAGSGYVIYMVITKWTDDLAKTDIVQKQNVLALFVEFLPSATITALNIVVPAIFSTLVTIEYLSPDAVVEITVARSVILRLASVVVLVVSLHARINDCRNDNEDGCKNCKEIPCWETYVGIEFYKLVVMDFIVTIITTGVEFIRRIVANHLGDEALFGRLMAMKEFNLPANVLDIVYAQTICWIGAFFCPLIPAITVVKFFLYFYLKKITLLRNFPSSPSAFRASKTNSFFMAILLVSFVLCAIAMAFVIGRLHPSQSCGPWRVYSKDDYYMYVSMSDLVATAPHVWGDILGFLISWLFYVPMLILMSLVIYYNMAMAAGHKMIINILRSEMVLEGQKKQFNLKQLLNTLMDPAKQQTNKKHKRHK